MSALEVCRFYPVAARAEECGRVGLESTTGSYMNAVGQIPDYRCGGLHSAWDFLSCFFHVRHRKTPMPLAFERISRHAAIVTYDFSSVDRFASRSSFLSLFNALQSMSKNEGLDLGTSHA